MKLVRYMCSESTHGAIANPLQPPLTPTILGLNPNPKVAIPVLLNELNCNFVTNMWSL